MVAQISGDPSVIDADGTYRYDFVTGAEDLIWQVIQAWPNGGQQGLTHFVPQYNLQPTVPGYTLLANKMNVQGFMINEMVRVV